MSAPTVRGADAKEFVKLFQSICQWNANWDRWNDMVHLFAIEIANVVDLNHREERNREYIRIAEKYQPEEFKRFADLFCLMVECLERNPFQDFLGQMYMELDMGSKWHGQCFTPYSVCQMMANVAMPEDKVKQQLEDRGWISINDCACGAGATLIAAAEHLMLMDVNYQQKALFIAQDLDSTVAMMCYIQLSLIGCAGRVRIGDTLLNPDNSDTLLGDGKSTTWYTPIFYSDIWAGRCFARHLQMAMGGLMPDAQEVTQNDQKAEQIAIKAEQKPEKVPEMPMKAYQAPELVAATKIKRSMSEGQLMFDLTGGM